MSDAEEIAKAIHEGSKLGAKSLGTAEKVGGFFAKVCKVPAYEVVRRVGFAHHLLELGNAWRKSQPTNSKARS